MTGDETRQPHSAAFFGPYRDFWWNLDHLELIAARRALADVKTVLDVGAGVGHWGQLLLRVLGPDASVVGIEREPEWVQKASRRAEQLGLADRCSYRQGAAQSLPFDDATFDLVTCQTVLIHVPDPLAVVREMLRVTRPGGQVIVAEPNNRASLLVASSTTVGELAEALVDLIGFYVTCEQGKIALGEGNSSVGDLLPGLFTEAGLADVEAFLSDKASVMVPPYASEEQQALKAQYEADLELSRFGWSREEAKRLFVAGGGVEASFEAGWQRRRDEAQDAVAALDDGTLHSAGGAIHYLVAGRRPV
jgi:SAM-dependent methyltransferase